MLCKADKSDIASTTVLSNAISLPTSSVVCVATQAIWLEIAQIDNVELIGVMGLHQEPCLVALLLDGLAAAMLLIGSMR